VSLIADISRTDASKLIASGGATVDGTPAPSGKVRLREGQVVVVDLDMVPVAEPPGPDASIVLDIVYVDEDIIVVNKAAGLVVHPASGHGLGTLVNGILALYPEVADVGQPARPGIVHRLDAGTTGMMVVARSQRAYDSLVAALTEHEVGREYIALAWGHFDSPTAVVDAAMGRDPRDPMRMAVVHNGKWARTHLEVETEFNHPALLTLVRCSLETGRTHQIRVHFSALHHPLVGDTTYGADPVLAKSLGMARPWLHALELRFAHPITGAPMSFKAPYPSDLQTSLGLLSDAVLP